MDDGAFRASVFASKSSWTLSPPRARPIVASSYWPAGRHPLDVARDKARADAREVGAQHSRLRGMLPDVEEAKVAAADAEARASALEVAAVEEEGAVAAARQAAGATKESFDRLDRPARNTMCS